MSTMEAVVAHQHGGIDGMRLETLDRPQPGEGQVLVRVRAAGVNPADWKMVQLGFAPLPFRLGRDVSGVVEALGPGASGLSVGDAVYGVTDFGGGTYAQYTAARPATLARKPATLDFSEAAAVPLAAVSAWQALFDEADLQSGQTVLIHGAAGGIGTFAVQLAKWKGARVIATASSANLALLRELGADEVIDYTAARFEDAVRDVDVVFDTVGGDYLDRSLAVLKDGGVGISMINMNPPVEQAGARGQRVLGLQSEVTTARFNAITRLMEAGTVRVVIDSTYPLDRFADALARSQAGYARGRIVLTLAD